jgi:hypothetical protein
MGSSFCGRFSVCMGRMCLTGAFIATTTISADDFGSVAMARFEVARPYMVYGDAMAATHTVI